MSTTDDSPAEITAMRTELAGAATALSHAALWLSYESPIWKATIAACERARDAAGPAAVAAGEDYIREVVRAASDNDLAQPQADCSRPTTTNCGFPVYAVRDMVREHVTWEQSRRARPAPTEQR